MYKQTDLLRISELILKCRKCGAENIIDINYETAPGIWDACQECQADFEGEVWEALFGVADALHQYHKAHADNGGYDDEDDYDRIPFIAMFGHSISKEEMEAGISLYQEILNEQENKDE
jgi:ribosomal protein L37AE/L43A